jgi:hypothetical protein
LAKSLFEDGDDGAFIEKWLNTWDLRL